LTDSQTQATLPHQITQATATRPSAAPKLNHTDPRINRNPSQRNTKIAAQSGFVYNQKQIKVSSHI